MKYQNANMYQKSLIQVILEHNDMIECLKQTINSIMESYTINGNVFGLRGGRPCEITSGYFVIESETDSLQAAIREMKSMEDGIRIINNAQFQIGSINNYITECATDKKVIDLETHTEIER